MNERKVLQSGPYTNEVRKLIKLSPKKKTEFVQQMEKYANNYLETNFDMKLTIPIEICGRLTRTGGAFHHQGGYRKSIKIKMSERFVALALLDEADGVNAILDILNHELVHYALYEKGSKEYSDGQVEFEQALARLGIGASGATNDKKIITKKKTVWYSLLDVYHEPLMNKTYKYRHANAEVSWSGKRVGFEIVKKYF